MKIFNKGKCKKVGSITINSGINDLIESEVLINYIKRDGDLSTTIPVIKNEKKVATRDKKIFKKKRG